jgi:hypothetical protein
LPNLSGNPSIHQPAQYDFDQDGIPNYLDLDSDNDGITDLVETFGYAHDNSGPAPEDGRMDGWEAADTQANGWHDACEGLVATVADQSGSEKAANKLPDYLTGEGQPDYDGDGLPNYLDIDSDDDGIVDLIEAQASGLVAKFPFNGLPGASAVDVNYDGLLDEFAPATGGTYCQPLNVDNLQGPDYLDLDTDEDGYNDLLEGHDADFDAIADHSPSGQDTDQDGLDDAFDTNLNSTDLHFSNQSVPDFNDDLGSGGERDWRDVHSFPLLPAEWESFGVRQQGRDAVLDWATLREENCAFYEVQRSLDGISYERRGEVAAAGFSEGRKAYAFLDEGAADLAVSTLYFRLRQVDFDGQFAYSQVVALNLSATSNWQPTLFPNPSKGPVTVRWEGAPRDQAVELWLLTQQGQVLKQATAPAGTLEWQWQTDELPAGTYFVRLKAGAEQRTLTLQRR